MPDKDILRKAAEAPADPPPFPGPRWQLPGPEREEGGNRVGGGSVPHAANRAAISHAMLTVPSTESDGRTDTAEEQAASGAGPYGGGTVGGGSAGVDGPRTAAVRGRAHATQRKLPGYAEVRTRRRY